MRNEKNNELLAYQSMHGQELLEVMGADKEEDVNWSDQQRKNRNEADPPAQVLVFNETSKEQEQRIRKESPFGTMLTWKLMRIIVKSNDDMRQEQFAMQLISQFDQIFKQKKLDLWMKPYEILATGQRCGIIECATDALSIDSIKKKMGRNS